MTVVTRIIVHGPPTSTLGINSNVNNFQIELTRKHSLVADNSIPNIALPKSIYYVRNKRLDSAYFKLRMGLSVLSPGNPL